MSPPKPPDKYKPRSSGMMDFEPVSLASAKRSLDELPIGLERAFNAVPGYWEKVRRRPIGTDRALTGTALDWLIELPDNLRPHVTNERYPRVVNAIALSWPDSEERTELFDHLLNDRRTGRRGFPIEVEREIAALCLFATSLPE